MGITAALQFLPCESRLYQINSQCLTIFHQIFVLSCRFKMLIGPFVRNHCFCIAADNPYHTTYWIILSCIFSKKPKCKCASARKRHRSCHLLIYSMFSFTLWIHICIVFRSDTHEEVTFMYMISLWPKWENIDLGRWASHLCLLQGLLDFKTFESDLNLRKFLFAHNKLLMLKNLAGRTSLDRKSGPTLSGRQNIWNDRCEDSQKKISKYLPSSPFFAFFASILSWNSTKILTCTSASSESSCFSCKCFFVRCVNTTYLITETPLVTACCIAYLVDDNVLHLPIFATLLLDLIVELLINLIRSDLGQSD